MRKYVIVKPRFSLLGLRVELTYIRHIYWRSNNLVKDVIITLDLDEAMVLELDEIGYCRWIDIMAIMPTGFRLRELKER